MEPFEEATVIVPETLSGTVIEKMSKRRGLMVEMKSEHRNKKINFEIPTRGLLGYRSQFVLDTKGEGIMSSHFLEFRPYAGEIQ